MDDDSDSGSDFGGFASDDLGGNQHVAATLGTGSDIDLSDWDVNGASSSSSDSDGDGGDGGNAASLTWTSATTDVVVDPFLPQQVGPAILLGPQAKPVDYFLAMFGMTTFVVMAKQTNLYATQVQDKAGKLVRVAMYFRSTFVESCNQIHFWKAETSLKPKTNVSI